MIPAWIVITLVLLAILIFLVRSVNKIYVLQMIKENFFYYFAVAVFIFLAVSLTRLHSIYDFDFTTYEGFARAGKIYLTWLGKVFSNIGKITGYAFQQDWVGNSSNLTGR